MTDAERIIRLYRAGLGSGAIAAILDTDDATVRSVVRGVGSLPASSAPGVGSPAWAQAAQLDFAPDFLAPGQVATDWGYTGIYSLPDPSVPNLLVVQFSNTDPVGWASVAAVTNEAGTESLELASISDGGGGASPQGTITLTVIVPAGLKIRCGGSYATGDPVGGGVSSLTAIPLL